VPEARACPAGDRRRVAVPGEAGAIAAAGRAEATAAQQRAAASEPQTQLAEQMRGTPAGDDGACHKSSDNLELGRFGVDTLKKARCVEGEGRGGVGVLSSISRAGSEQLSARAQIISARTKCSW